MSVRTVACSHCGAMNSKTKLCRACGGKLEPDAPATEPDAPRPTAAHCPNCGAEQVAGDKFCRECGAAQQGSSTPAASVQPGPTNGFAIASLVLALVGGALLAVIFGHVALSQIDKSGGRQQGSGLAAAGLIIGYIEIAVFLFFFLFLVARPSPTPF